MEYDADRFWSKVDVRGDDDCWLWTAGKFSDGYGAYHIKEIRQNRRAHRISFAIVFGETDEQVNHVCDEPLCCNPLHLWEGTQADNVRDMMKKERGAGQFRRGFDARRIRRNERWAYDRNVPGGV